jgi:glycosyltransferase involved in cell wall biosynthesis
MKAVLDRARSLADEGVTLHEPIPKAELARRLGESRAMLYRGDPGETFCLAVGEAQAAGVPCVVQDIGCVAERVVDGKTGFVARGEDGFADAAIRLLTDDALWRSQHDAAIRVQRAWGWDDAAAEFEKLIS